MRRKLLFASRVALGFGLALLASFVILLMSIAPNRVDSGIAWVYLRHPEQSLVRISGHQLVCDRKPNMDQCTIPIQARPLQISVIYKDGTKRQMWDYDNIRCQATYDEQPVNCSVNYDYATGALPFVEINDDLGLSPQQFQALQNQVNPLFRFNDDDWMNLAIGMAISIGVLVAIAIALQPQPHALLVGLGNTVGSGAVMFALASFLMAASGQSFNLVLVAAASIATSIVTSLLLWFRRDRLAKIVTILTSGFVTFSILWYAFLISLLALGFVD